MVIMIAIILLHAVIFICIGNNALNLLLVRI